MFFALLQNEIPIIILISFSLPLPNNLFQFFSSNFHYVSFIILENNLLYRSCWLLSFPLQSPVILSICLEILLCNSKGNKCSWYWISLLKKKIWTTEIVSIFSFTIKLFFFLFIVFKKKCTFSKMCKSHLILNFSSHIEAILCFLWRKLNFLSIYFNIHKLASGLWFKFQQQQ